MYTFLLPQGAIVELLGERYFHEGNGVFTGMKEKGRPHIFEGIAREPTEHGKTRFTAIYETPKLDGQLFRVVHIAATHSELAKGIGTQAFKGLTEHDFPSALPEHDLLALESVS